MDYDRLSRRELKKILNRNRPEFPHYQKALEELKRRDQSRMLIVACGATLLTTVSLLLGLAHTLAAQVKQESWQRLPTMNQQFENYKNDFIQFGQVSPRNPEDTTDVQLVVVADQVVVHLEYVETMLAIYHTVSNKQDRLSIWPLITDQMDFTRKRLDQQIQVTNTLISTLRTPGVVAEAMKMRDDLRRIEEDLDGVRKEYEAAEAKLP